MMSVIEKIKKNIDLNTLLKICVLVLLLFGVSIYLSFSTDTYFLFAKGFKYAASDMLTRNGRPIIALVYYLYSLTNLSGEIFYYLSSITALVLLTISIYILNNTLSNYVTNNNIRIILSFTLTANIFIIEYFTFIEKFAFMLAILFVILAFSQLEKHYRLNNKKNYYLSIIYMILAMFTYQAVTALLIMLSIPLIYRYSKDIKDYLFNIVKVGIIYVIPAVLMLIGFKFIFIDENNRVSLAADYISNLKSVISQLKNLLVNTFNLLPSRLYEILLVIILIMSLVLLLKNKNKLFQLINIVIIIVGSCLFSTITLVQGSGWMDMRVVYPLASLLSVLILNIFMNLDKDNKLVNTTIIICLCVLLVFQYLSFNKIYIHKYRMNYSDRLTSIYIGQAIKEYEEESGNTITKIAFYTDSEATWPYYPNLYTSGDTNVSFFFQSWSKLDGLNYYLHTTYEEIESDSKYEEYFSSKNWTSLSKEQLIFDGDTLHLCVY